MDFGDAISKVSTIADKTKKPISTLREDIIKLSNSTGISAKEIADAEYEALSAGVDTAKSMEFLKVAVKAAKGGFTDTATAVDGLTTTLNSYGLEADKANDIANQMLITQNLGKTTFRELASTVGKVTPVASALGLKTEELFSSLAVTTAQGLDTAESVTGLKAALSNIIKPSKEASDAAEMLGIKFSASEVKAKGWMPFLQDLNGKLKQASPEFAKMSNQMSINAQKMSELEKAGKKGSKEYKTLSKSNKNLIKDMELLAKASDSPLSAFATMFGSVEGLNSVLMMTSDNGMNLYNESMKQMFTNTKALDDAYDSMQNPGEKFRKSLNKMHNVFLKIGDSFTPVVIKLTSYIDKVADKFSKLTPEQSKNIAKFILAAAAIGPIISGLGKLTSTTAKTISSINKFSKGVQKAGGLLGFLSSPGHKFIIIMTALALVAILVITHWDKVKKCFNSISKSISKATGISQDSVNKFLIGAITGLTTLFSFGTIFTKGFGGGFKLLNKIIKGSGKGTFNTFKLLGKGLLKSLKGTISIIKAAGKGAGIALKGIGTGAATAFKLTLKIITIAGKGIGKGLMSMLKVSRIVGVGIIKAASRVFIFLAANPVALIIAAIIGVCILLYNAWKHNWGGIRDKTKVVIDFCKQKIDSIKETFANVKAKCVEFGTKIKEVWQGIKTFLAHPIQGTVSLIKHGNLSGVNGKNALGTKYWSGGLSIVGEYGPEVVELPSGSKIHSNKDSISLINKAKIQTIKQKLIAAKIPKVLDSTQNIRQKLKQINIPKVPDTVQTIKQKLIAKDIKSPIHSQQKTIHRNRISTIKDRNVNKQESKKNEVKINISRLVVREESDIDKIANAIVKKIQIQRLNMARGTY